MEEFNTVAGLGSGAGYTIPLERKVKKKYSKKS
jgi:hypothetical protein